MKKKALLFFIPLFILASTTLNAQNNVIPACIDTLVKKSGDSLVHAFRSSGFSLLNTASLTMESEYESAIIVELKKGNSYVLAFVGVKTSKLIQVTMFDPEQARVAYEKQKLSDNEGNMLIFSFRPESSGYHIINPLQSNKKKKTICGQMMLFKRDHP